MLRDSGVGQHGRAQDTFEIVGGHYKGQARPAAGPFLFFAAERNQGQEMPAVLRATRDRFGPHPTLQPLLILSTTLTKFG
jgi:hypothetical protein